MRAMVLASPHTPLRAVEVPLPTPGPDQVRIRVTACGVCRTDLHVAGGELPGPKLPLIPGHEIVGTVAQKGDHRYCFALPPAYGAAEPAPLLCAGLIGYRA